MNLRASHPNRIDLGAVGGDLKRFETIVAERIKASGGPFLFGKFSAADAMRGMKAARRKERSVFTEVPSSKSQVQKDRRTLHFELCTLNFAVQWI